MHLKSYPPLTDEELTQLKHRIHLYESLNYASIYLWAKYEHLFHEGDKKELLALTITTYKEKLINSLAKLEQSNVEDVNNNLVSTFFSSSYSLPSKAPNQAFLNKHFKQ